MATTKKASAKKTILDDYVIISNFMNDILVNNEEPKNIYIFCEKVCVIVIIVLGIIYIIVINNFSN